MSELLIAIPGPPGRHEQYLEAELLASYLRLRGHEVILDDLSRYPSSELAVQRILRHDSPTIYWHLPTATEISTLVEWSDQGLLPFRDTFPRLVLAGGHVATHFAHQILSRVESLRAVVRGELELPIAWLLEKSPDDPWTEGPSLVMRDAEGGVRTRPPSPDSPLPLSALPPAADDLVTPSDRTIQRVLLSRGCQSACRYCGFARYFATLSPDRNKLWRPRPAKEVVDEIETLRDDHGINRFAFQAAVFFGYDTGGSDAVQALCEELIRRRLEIHFQIVTHPGHLLRNAGLLPLLIEAGLERVSLGLDGGSDEVLRRYGVDFTCKQGLEALALLSRHDVSVMPSFIFYDPYTSAQEIREQIHFLEKARPYFRHEQRPFSFFLDRYFLKRPLEPKTFMPLIEQLETDGLVVLDPEAPWKRPRVRFRDPEIAAFHRAHLRLDRELLVPLRPILWNRRRTDPHPGLDTLPLDLLRRLAQGLGDGKPLEERRAFEIGSELIRERLGPLRPMVDGLSSNHREQVSRVLGPA